MLLAVARRWHGADAATDRLLKHACRTHLKRGDARALALFGFDQAVVTEVRGLTVDPRRLSIGQRVAFTFDVRHRAPTAVTLRLEYAIEFARPGGRTFRKVFQIGERVLSPGWHAFERRHAFQDLSTRTHHPGRHRLEVLVNGRPGAIVDIDLTPARRSTRQAEA